MHRCNHASPPDTPDGAEVDGNHVQTRQLIALTASAGRPYVSGVDCPDDERRGGDEKHQPRASQAADDTGYRNGADDVDVIQFLSG